MEGHDPQATTVAEYLAGTAKWRTDLYATCGTVLSHSESIALFRELDVKMTPELKRPEVPMPFGGEYSQTRYAQHMIDEYKAAGVAPARVYPQSFNLDDIRYLIANEPAFAAQAVYLDGRYERDDFDASAPASLSPTMAELAAEGVRIIAPPLWVLLTLDETRQIQPSAYARAARAAGLDIITWTLERSGPLRDHGGWYYQSIASVIDNDGDMLRVLHALAQQVGVIGVFSDWPATVTYYANCLGLNPTLVSYPDSHVQHAIGSWPISPVVGLISGLEEASRPGRASTTRRADPGPIQ